MKATFIKVLVCVTIAFVCLYILTESMKAYMKSTTPDVIWDMERKAESAITSELVGGVNTWECVYSGKDEEKDTLQFKLTVYGFSRKMVLDNIAIKHGEKHWKIIQTDTTFINR